MVKKSSLEREIHALREELVALKTEAASRAAEAPPEPTDSPDTEEPPAASPFGDLSEIQKAVDDFIKSTKDEISERPGAAVVMAFLVGIMIGRLTKS